MSAMLPLDSARWAELEHAYGSAEDIPRLLGALATAEGERERGELWYGAMATLCPEGRAVSASYAAAPHLLAIGDAHGAPEQVTALHVVAMIEINRHGTDSSPMPSDLIEPYAMAIESMPRRVADLFVQPWDASSAQVLAAALLVGKRQPVLARTLLALGDDES
ncbi:MAG: hypothetical protein ABIY52_08855 [Gemmatimonadaceae bacterium]